MVAMQVMRTKRKQLSKIQRQRESRDRLADALVKITSEMNVIVLNKMDTGSGWDSLVERHSRVVTEYQTVNDKILQQERRS